MSKIKLITDGGADIKPSVAERYNIRVIPFSYTFDGENYCRTGIDETTDEFYARMRASEVLPKTTQITPGQYTEAYLEEIENGYDTIIVVSLSSTASGACQNAIMAAKEVMEDNNCDIRVVDSQSFTCLYGQPVIHAAHMIEDGASVDEIEDYLKKATADINAVFVVDDLIYLKKGGRINAATLLFANMLDIKPMLMVGGGLVVQADKVRGEKRVHKKIMDMATEHCGDLNGKTVIFVYGDVPDKRDKLEADVKERFPEVNVKFCRIGQLIGCHIGPTVYGMVYSTSGEFDISDYEEE